MEKLPDLFDDSRLKEYADLLFDELDKNKDGIQKSEWMQLHK